jgi:glycosyltransferase involved in cell wall biosynthesis
MHVTFVGSHLFEPTHHSLAGLFQELKEHLNITILAKHPAAHKESGTPVPQRLALSQSMEWRPATDVVHAVGGGETAILVGSVLCPTIPLVVSFVGGADLTRQLSQERLRAGYRNLFDRCRLITYADGFGLSRLRAFGAPHEKLRRIPAALPLSHYKAARPAGGKVALMAGRPIRRKNHARAVELSALSKQLQKLIVVGQVNTPATDSRVACLGVVPHQELIELLSGTDVLLQTGDWEGDEIDSLPTIVLEALAMGIPVISTPLPGVVELHNAFPEFIRIAEGAAEMADCLDAILTRPQKLDASEVRAWVLRNHGRGRVVAELVALYEGFLR